MAISYSYPMGTPKLTDTVLGVQYEEMKDPAVKNFSIDDIVVLAAAEITPTPGPAGPQGLQGVAGAQGVQGIQGTPGEIGPAGLTWQGSWNKNTSYVEDDAVGYGGSSYFCILTIPGSILNDNPVVDTTHWALLASQGATGPQGVQGIQGLQGVQGIQGIPGTSATQTLQQTVDLGNTISGIAGGVTFTTTLTKSSIKIGESVNSGITLNPGQFVCEKNGGSDLMILQFPAVYSGINQITLPNATGMAALTSDITLQKAIDGGNTITDGVTTMTVTASSIETNDFLGGGVELVSDSGLNPYLKFKLPASAGKTVTLTSADTQTASRTIKLPDNDGTIALISDIPAIAYTKYVCNLNQTGITDPSVQVLENTIGSIVWTRTGVGQYIGTLSGAFPSALKTWFSKPNTQSYWGNYGGFLSRISANEIQLLTTDTDQITPVDGAYATSFEIRVYP